MAVRQRTMTCWLQSLSARGGTQWHRAFPDSAGRPQAIRSRGWSSQRDGSGLLLCSWPKGGALSLPFIYSNEVWTGIEYQVASHLMLMGHIAEGLEIVRTCRDRYDGRVRNPFDEYECGHWYARALSSYALLQGVSGARYDAVDEVLHLQPAIQGDFRSFIATATGYGTVGVKAAQPFLEVVSGKIPVKKIHYAAAT
jgi:Glycosyl-hydrolase family 116, catalytic region